MESRTEKIIIGHRGSRGLEPENTLAAALKAIRLGAGGLELDLFLTKDGKVVVTHDATISPELCLNPEGKPLSGDQSKRLRIFDLNFDQLKPFDCGSEPNPDFPEQENREAHIPLLSEVIERAEKERKYGPIRYFLEIKSDRATEGHYHPEPATFVSKVLEVVSAKQVELQSMILSFDERVLKEVKKQAPDIKIGMSLESKNDLEMQIEALGFWPDALLPLYKEVDKELLELAAKQNIPLYPWTVNEEQDMRAMFEMDVKGLITDYPDRALKIMKETL